MKKRELKGTPVNKAKKLIIEAWENYEDQKESNQNESSQEDQSESSQEE
jgi:hypothetical protein